MTYDWEGTLNIKPRTSEWFDEIDRRFLSPLIMRRWNPETHSGDFFVPIWLTEREFWKLAAEWVLMPNCWPARELVW
jgi:hypothetical protein